MTQVCQLFLYITSTAASAPLTDQYSTLCSISGDLTNVGYTTGVGTDGQRFYRFGFDLVILFGMTELKALLAWEEGGIEKRFIFRLLVNHLLNMHCFSDAQQLLYTTSVMFSFQSFHGFLYSVTGVARRRS